MEEWLTVVDVARYLKISKDTIYKFAQKGTIPASKIGRQWRFNRTDIDSWIKKGQSGFKRPVGIY
ncbi:MAG: helix-turn-helix domain-containing protein [Candidatus Omnitrophota bacterium]